MIPIRFGIDLQDRAVVQEACFEALTSNFLFIADACIFSIGIMEISLLLDTAPSLVGLLGVVPFATLFVIMRITKQSPIGIPFEPLSPPLPAVIVIGGSSLLLIANAISGWNSGRLNVAIPSLALLVLIPNLIALRHRRAGWLNQPKPAAQ